MSIQYFQPEVWAASLLTVLEKALVFAGAPCVNRDYEGDIAEYGDTVHIESISDPTIRDYTKDTDITVETLTDAERLLLIDQQKYFGFEVDDIDKRQVRNDGGLMSEAAKRAAFGLRDKADQFVASKMVAGAGTSLGLVDATTATNVYDKLLVPAKVALDRANVPTDGRFIVVEPGAEGQLLLDSRFIKQNESGTDTGLRNGVIGRAAGFVVLSSNNAPRPDRTTLTASTHSGTKVIDGAAAGTFNQGDVGASISGTGVGASNTIASVTADGTSVTTTVNSSASATVSDVAVSTATGTSLAIAGSSIGTTYAEQIAKVEAFRPEKRFADALKGLHLYGAKVTRGNALVVANVKTA